MANAQPCRLLTRFCQQMRCQRRRHTGDGDGIKSELFLGNGRHQSTIHPAGIGHTNLSEAADHGAQPLQLELFVLCERFQLPQHAHPRIESTHAKGARTLAGTVPTRTAGFSPVSVSSDHVRSIHGRQSQTSRRNRHRSR